MTGTVSVFLAWRYSSRFSAGTSDQSCESISHHSRPLRHGANAFTVGQKTGSFVYLVKVDDWLPEVVLLLVEVAHTNLSEVTRMVLVHVGTVVVLTTSKTTSTGMLAVLSYTSLTGGDMTAAMKMSVQCTTKF